MLRRGVGTGRTREPRCRVSSGPDRTPPSRTSVDLGAMMDPTSPTPRASRSLARRLLRADQPERASDRVVPAGQPRARRGCIFDRSTDAIYGIEHVNAHNADVASPADVQAWAFSHGKRPRSVGNAESARRSGIDEKPCKSFRFRSTLTQLKLVISPVRVRISPLVRGAAAFGVVASVWPVERQTPGRDDEQASSPLVSALPACADCRSEVGVTRDACLSSLAGVSRPAIETPA
jgi:hypothetical protein